MCDAGKHLMYTARPTAASIRYYIQEQQILSTLTWLYNPTLR